MAMKMSIPRPKAKTLSEALKAIEALEQENRLLSEELALALIQALRAVIGVSSRIQPVAVCLQRG